MHRTFDMRTNLFRLPQGTSPTDKENIELVKRAIKSGMGAENVKVGFHEGPDGSPLIDQYKIEAEFPRFIADNQYVSLAKQGALDGQAAEVIGRIIQGLAKGQDVTADIEKLLQMSKGKKGDDDNDNPEQGSAASGTPGGLPGQSGRGSGGPGAGPGGFGAKSDDKPKMPFANKKSRLNRAMLLEKKLRIPLAQGVKLAQNINTNDFEDFVNRIASVKAEFGLDNRDAFDIVNLVDRSRDWYDFHKTASKTITDENGNPFSNEDYVKIAAVARGEKSPLV